MSPGLLWLWASFLLMSRVVFLFYWRISIRCLALELAGSWVELGLSLGMDDFGFWIVSCIC